MKEFNMRASMRWPRIETAYRPRNGKDALGGMIPYKRIVVEQYLPDWQMTVPVLKIPLTSVFALLSLLALTG